MKRGKTQILAEFIEGITNAEGAASQLVSAQANPKWMAVRDMLNVIKDGCIANVVTQTVG